MNQVKLQRGSTLIVALIMLVLLTLIAVSAMNSTTNSIQVVGNAQFHEEAGAAAQAAIEQVISDTNNFSATPTPTPITGGIYTGVVDAPVCTSSMALTNTQLNWGNPADVLCASDDKKTNTGMIGPKGVIPTTNSLCFKQSWDVRATVTDTNTGASTTVHQGVFKRVQIGTNCP